MSKKNKFWQLWRFLPARLANNLLWGSTGIIVISFWIINVYETYQNQGIINSRLMIGLINPYLPGIYQLLADDFLDQRNDRLAHWSLAYNSFIHNLGSENQLSQLNVLGRTS